MFSTETMMVIPTPKCRECGVAEMLQVPADGYDLWASGTPIQDAFPGLSRDTREQLITGYHSECWDTAFGGWDEE